MELVRGVRFTPAIVLPSRWTPLTIRVLRIHEPSGHGAHTLRAPHAPRPWLRFHWLLLTGLIAVVLAFFSMFRLGFNGGPLLSFRHQVTYQATSTLLITQPGPSPPMPRTTRVGLSDPNRFSALAMLYAELANSDAIRTRIRAGGPLKGTYLVTAAQSSDDEMLPYLAITGIALWRGKSASRVKPPAPSKIRAVDGCRLHVRLALLRTNPRGEGMIGVIVTLGPGEGLDRQRASAVAEQEAPKFEGMDGLLSKVFMWNDETGTAISTYVWDSESAARAFFTPELKAKVIELYGVEPQVQFAEVSALVDNRVAVA